jgi:hypothetical protein
MFVSTLSSCKKDYEAPPSSYFDPNIAVTTTIKDLKAMHTVAGAFDKITTDIVIAGTVIADDKSGNLYKELYIRDNTGAIAVELASTGLYANYPVGRKLFIKCNGMCISDYHNMIKLGIKSISNGLVSLEGIPAPLIANYVTGGSLNNNAAPKVVTAADLALSTPVMQNTLLGDLVKLNDYEFMIGDTKRSYGDTSYYHSTLGGMVNIKNCAGDGPFIVLTSGYADFATKAPQAGNGSFTGIYTVYNSTPQFVIRDTTDVNFAGPRCFLFEEDFQAYTTSGTSCWSQTGWQNIKESGDVCYTLASFSGSFFPKVSAFASTAMPTTNITSWLIAPPITIPAGISPKLSYTCSSRYYVGTLKAMVSTNYDGTSLTPSTATWVELNTIQANSASFINNVPFPATGGYDLSAYAGKKIYFAFRYDAPSGTAANQVATYEPDNIKIASK